MAPLRLLLTGATGFIGGSVLNTLQNSQHKPIRDLDISVLVRGEDQAKVLKEHGVNPILFESFDDSVALTKAASEHDIVIHTATGFHTGAAKALVIGLGQRKKTIGKDVYYFHTTGTSNIADRPVSKLYFEPRILSDKDDLYTYLRKREDQESYVQRTTDLVVIDTGLEYDIKTYLIMPPTIYGKGSGLFNQTSIQIPMILRAAIKTGKVDVIEEGTGVWDAVHISDLVLLYELLLSKVLEGEDIPSGKQGVYFAETGDYTHRELAEGLAAELYKQGAIKQAEVNQITLQEAADFYTRGNVKFIELSFASNSRSRAEFSRELGWKPLRTRGDFKKNFEEEVAVIIAQQGVEGLKVRGLSRHHYE